MMLTTLFLNPEHRQARSDLRNNYSMHQTVSRMFEIGSRPLFRIEAGRVVIGCATQAPRLENLPVGYYSERAVTEYPLLGNGDVREFRLFANPTKSHDRRRRPLYNPVEQANWLHRKAEAGGFEVLCVDSMKARKIAENYSAPTHEDKYALPLLGVDFRGVLRVLDAEKFAQCIAAGIGSQKAFGMGLLLV